MTTRVSFTVMGDTLRELEIAALVELDEFDPDANRFWLVKHDVWRTAGFKWKSDVTATRVEVQ